MAHSKVKISLVSDLAGLVSNYLLRTKTVDKGATYRTLQNAINCSRGKSVMTASMTEDEIDVLEAALIELDREEVLTNIEEQVRHRRCKECRCIECVCSKAA